MTISDAMGSEITSQSYEGKRMLQRAEGLDSSWAFADGNRLRNNKDSLCLLDNVQFIYELALAQLELQGLETNYEITNGLREFKLLGAKDITKLIKRLAYFKVVEGEYTDYFRIIQKNRTRSVNQYLTHWIYPYKGKFHPQMIRALLNIIKVEPGDTILDPFIGSGTTAVEAQLLGINCVGIDVSPLCVLQSRVKTESVSVLNGIIKVKESIASQTQPSLLNPKSGALDQAIDLIGNEKIRDFYKVAELVAISDSARRRRNFADSFFKNLSLMIYSVKDYAEIVKKLDIKLGQVDIKVGDARNLSLDKDSVDGIITSPPYSIALDYVANDAHAFKALDFELKEMKQEFIGLRGKGQERIGLYNQDMEKSLKEIYRVLKPGKHAVIVIGNATYLGEEIKTVEFTVERAKKIGFKLVKNIDKIIFGLYNVMQREHILIFQKPLA